MTEKEALIHAFEYAQSPFRGDIAKMKAARAILIIFWLHDKNWHPEAVALQEKACANVYLRNAFNEITVGIPTAAARLEDAASLLNYIFGWGLSGKEWQSTRGDLLVNELWDLVVANK